MPLVAERHDIQIEALLLDAGLFGDVIEDLLGELRLAGLGAQAGELVVLHVVMVFALRFGVGEGIHRFVRFRGHLVCLSVSFNYKRRKSTPYHPRPLAGEGGVRERSCQSLGSDFECHDR